MVINRVKNGTSFTSTSTEQEIELDGATEPDVQVLTLVLISGSVQLGVAARGISPVIDATYTTWSTVGDKIIKTVQNGKNNLRVIGSGVISVNW